MCARVHCCLCSLCVLLVPVLTGIASPTDIISDYARWYLFSRCSKHTHTEIHTDTHTLHAPHSPCKELKQIKPKPKYTADKNINFSPNLCLLCCLCWLRLRRLGALSLLISMIRACSVASIFTLIHYNVSMFSIVRQLHVFFSFSPLLGGAFALLFVLRCVASHLLFSLLHFHLEWLLLRTKLCLCFSYFHLYCTLIIFVCFVTAHAKCGYRIHNISHRTWNLCRVM